MIPGEHYVEAGPVQITFFKIKILFHAMNYSDTADIYAQKLGIKAHGSVSCSPRKCGTRKLREYINRNN